LIVGVESKSQSVFDLRTTICHRADGYMPAGKQRKLVVTIQNRWLIAAAGVLMQVAFGAVYAWSVFRIPLSRAYGWSVAEVTAAFEIAIFMVGLAAFAGGLWMKRSGPRPVALAAAVLYGLGTMLTGTARDLSALYLAYGVIGGAGLGLGYIVPIATLVRWFPDKRGMITGLAVAGFGAGALVTAPVANSLIASLGVSRTFEALGLAYLVVVFACGLTMQNPPAGYVPDGYGAAVSLPGRSARDFTLRQALGTWQWYALWLTLFLNTTAGIAIISQASPMAQEISGVSAATAAAMVGLISIANGSGRFFWAWFSDAVGRRTVFLFMFLLQSAAFLLLSQVHRFALLSLFAFLILLCYGGGFGTMPAFATDYFGAGQVGSIYGLMLTARGCAAVFGPSLVAGIRQATGHYQGAMRWLALATLVSAVVPLLLRPPRGRQSNAFDVEPVGAGRRVRT
jgi:OFA family oxalate/formate antiporter-like MFS transporter